MLFNSYEFIFLFLPIVVSSYFHLNSIKKYEISKCMLICASLYFYSYFHKSYLWIILASILVNYTAGYFIGRSEQLYKKIFLFLGICYNLGILGYYKYYDFFISNVNYVFRSNIPLLHLLLPLGISFFTFQQLSFIIDCYRGENKKYSIVDYSLFVTFFPQLIAGPIVLPSEMLPQFEDNSKKKISYKNINVGLYLFIGGLFKKVVVADTLSIFVHYGFDVATNPNFLEAWIASLAYTLQIYYDFSGYCDMATGIAKMFNIDLPYNFNSPYKSNNIQEFWKRWHMTLGRFLTQYLYIPLGGNRKGFIKTLRNLWVVFLVSGVWHGAGWTFIIWGALHGTTILLHRIWKQYRKPIPWYLGRVLTFLSVNTFWVFFKANTIQDAIKILKGMYSLTSFHFFVTHITEIREISKPLRRNIDSFLGPQFNMVLFFIALYFVFYGKNLLEKSGELILTKKRCVWMSISLLVGIIFCNKVSTFLYFNF